MKAIELKITDEDYEYLRWLEEKEEEEKTEDSEKEEE